MELAQSNYDLADATVYYTAAGQGEPILLIHGSLCDYRYWRWQIESFSANHNVIAPSLRGCWPSQDIHPDDDYNTEQHALDLVEFSKSLLPGQKINILGHSRGAQVAIKMALLAPEICNSLILADPGFRFTDEAESTPFYLSTTDLLRNGQLEEALQFFVDKVNGEHTWKKMVAWFKEMARDNAMTLLSQINEANFAINASDIKNIQCPILLVNGKNSPTKYQSRCDRIQELQPDAKRVQIALASHGMNLANPRTFNKSVLDFIAI